MADVVVLATADWEHPIWTNKQHVAISIADTGFRVLYLDSLGLRPARATGRDLKRIIKRLWRGLCPPRRVRQNLWVWSPLVIPGGSGSFVILINKLSLAFGLWLALRFLRFRKPWLWTYNPLTASFLNLRSFSLKIYHAVDAVQEQPCMPRELIESQERRLCGEVDQVFVTSPALKRKLAPYSRHIRFDPNVADQAHFSKAMSLSLSSIPADIASIPEPRIGFIGAVSNYKLDFALIAAVARAHRSWQFVFIGPTGEGEPYTDTTLLDIEPNVHLLGQRPYGDLPNYCAGFSCGWLPLKLNPYTQAMFPMKFFEYLSAGLPIVATDIDALGQFGHVAFLCQPNEKDFSKALSLSLLNKGPDLALRLALAAEYTYPARTRRMLTVLRGLRGFEAI